MKALKESGKLDYVHIPKPQLAQALERESKDKYKFKGIINDTMKSYKLEDLERLSRKSHFLQDLGKSTHKNPLSGTEAGVSQNTYRTISYKNPDLRQIPMTPQQIA